MEMPKDYEETVGFTGEFETIKLGGHICKIISAKVEKSRTNKDMLVIAFDIVEGENEGYYQRRFDEAVKFNGINAKWQGVHRLMITDNEGKCNKFFKGFMTSVEASNQGYKFTGDESTLKDKKFGAIFGREQYEALDGTYKFATKIRFVRSIDNIKNAEIPEDKLLPPKSDIAFEEYASNESNDLPF